VYETLRSPFIFRILNVFRFRSGGLMGHAAGRRRAEKIAVKQSTASEVGTIHVGERAMSVISTKGFRAFLLFGGLLLSSVFVQAFAAEGIAVVRGNFIYSEKHQVPGLSDKNISYQVEAAVYNGVDAWRIAWNCDRIDAVHFIRRSDGAPLYVKRINHGLQRTVEVKYSLDSSKPSIYTRTTGDETVIRRIHQTGLMDLGTLPQILSGLAVSDDSDALRFSAINYDDGHVYSLLAKRIGYERVNMMMGEKVKCAIYEVNLDSWKAAFNPAVQVKVPTKSGLANFAMYSGPDPAGSGKKLTLRIVSRDSDVAVLQMQKKASDIH